MKKFDNPFIITIVAALLVGFLAGVVGELWLNSFLLPSPYLNFKSYADLSRKIDELISGERRQGINEFDSARDKMLGKIRPAVVELYRGNNVSAKTPGNLQANNFLGRAAIITSDGWLMAALETVGPAKNNLWAVTAEHQVVSVSVSAADKKSGVAFLKIEASNLPVVEFTLRRDLVDGQNIFLLGAGENILNSYFKNRNYSFPENTADNQRSSETFYKYMLMPALASKEFVGSPVITLDGKMAGLAANSAGLVLPVDHFARAMKQATSAEKQARPYLGVKFYDLADLIEPNNKLNRGAEVANVASDSPGLGILIPQDVIVKVENDEVGKNKNLPELIAAYRPAETIKLTVLRAAEQKEMNVKLGEKK